MNIEFQNEVGVKFSHSNSFRTLKNLIAKLRHFQNDYEVIQNKWIATLVSFARKDKALKLLNLSTLQQAFAFTLAETLIVIGVIGIVSALTLPNLNSSTGDKERVAKVKKIYQNLQDALGRAEAVYGPIGEWFISDVNEHDSTKRAAERITEFMKISKTCGFAKNQGCFSANKVSSLHDNSTGNSLDENSNYKVITADGVSLLFHFMNYTVPKAEITVDIDGPTKGSNTIGKDIFGFHFDPDLEDWELFPDGLESTSFSILVNNCYEGYSATAWIIKYDNADYLQLKDKNGTCKNGNVMTEANPTCR